MRNLVCEPLGEAKAIGFKNGSAPAAKFVVFGQLRKAQRGLQVGKTQKVSFSCHYLMEAICELFPTFRRLRMLRNWGGIVDCTPDRLPIIGLTPVPGLYVNCGWGTGGFKATPGSGHVFAATIARGEPHPINAPFSLDRFRTGCLIDEAAESHEPIQITGKRSNAVLLSAEDWRSIQETLYLLSIPGMRESLIKGMKTPLSKCKKEPGW